MRRRPWLAVIVVIVLCVASSSFAEEPGTRQLSVFASNLGYQYSSNSGSHTTGGGGLALSYWWKKNWSGSVSVARENYDLYTPGPPGELSLYRVGRVHTTPIDLEVRYHFVNDSRWQPYFGWGAHFLRTAQDSPGGPVHNRWGPTATAGVSLRITPRLYLDLSARQILRQGSNPSWDPGFKTMVGLGWRF
jgi:outer membrane protein W